jgi:hypothetical protein
LGSLHEDRVIRIRRVYWPILVKSAIGFHSLRVTVIQHLFQAHLLVVDVSPVFYLERVLAKYGIPRMFELPLI